ncbi:hypothetical protein D9M71_513300 [compost metagenome]
MPLGHQVQRNPGVEGLPGRLGKDPRAGNGVEVTATDDLLPAAFFRGRLLEMLFLATEDVGALFIAQALLIPGMLVEDHPQEAPEHAQATDDQERQFPAAVQDRPDHQGWRQQGANRRTDVEPADGDRTFLGRKPFGGGFDGRRQTRGFRQTEQAANKRQALPATRQCSQCAGNRPGEGKNREAHLGADGVDDVAGYRLHQRIANLPGNDDVRVLFGGNVHFAHQGRGGH